jgi:hypothetical protein
MKKIVLSALLGLLFQVIPARVNATIVSEGYTGAQLAFAIVFGFMLPPEASRSNNITGHKNETIAQLEFSTLNNNVESLTLLNQTAGGYLNTNEILK